jgi:glutaminyl-peptide cyclotransferase
VLLTLVAAQALAAAGLIAWAAGAFDGDDGQGREATAAGALAPRATVNRFDGNRAFALLREQVREYGPRPAGSDASRRLAERLRRALPEGRFEAIPGHPRLRNVTGRIPGRRPAIVVGAHYDTEATIPGHVGANDGAAGTAAVVELARSLRRMPRPRGGREVRFVLFDGEEEPAGMQDADFLEVGLRGSKAYVARHRRQVGRMILLDYIAQARGLSFPMEGTSDPALWGRMRAAARRVGVGRLFPDRVAGGVYDDHTPFLDAGIPAMDLIDFTYPQRDSTRDDLRAVSARSLDAVGEAVLELLRTERRR